MNHDLRPPSLLGSADSRENLRWYAHVSRARFTAFANLAETVVMGRKRMVVRPTDRARWSGEKRQELRQLSEPAPTESFNRPTAIADCSLPNHGPLDRPDKGCPLLFYYISILESFRSKAHRLLVNHPARRISARE
jgi:hypothetical protein